MMIQINAAARLKIMAKADESAARKYLKSLGIDVGALSFNGKGAIDFRLDNKQAKKAKAALTKQFGQPTVDSTPEMDLCMFKVDETRSLFVEVYRNAARPCLLGLNDDND
jgi:hypothetical protein